MIELKRITTGDSRHYAYMEQLLTASFPEEEYRDLKALREYTDTVPCFYCNIILEDATSVGLITYWDLAGFYYIEHLAIDPDRRNKGYGRKLLEHLADFFKKPVVLEVEYPVDETTRRRISFYQRHGYTLWEKEYFQPPYRNGHGKLRMYLMAKGNLNPEESFESIKKKIHGAVYNQG
ncbi:MAG: GNAT family N-acetyltransferase [Mediterranea sp.]|jgi:ribosomal protein S18 acetylase RimI-like enzyme|nr:GNAT family N-acetyltransferase [Mediterranea sp.]